MSLQELWRHGALLLDAGTFIGLRQQRFPLNNEVRKENQSGLIHPSATFLRRQKPNLDIMTLDVADMFDALTTFGPAGAENLGLNFENANATLYGVLDDGVSVAAGNVHRTYGIPNGILYPMTLECDTDGDWEFTLQGIVTHGGGANDSIIIGEASGLPVFPFDDKRFAMGPVKIGGIDLEGARRIAVNFNSETQGEAGDGDIWDTVSCLRNQMPVVAIEGMNARWFSDSVVPQLGLAALHTNTVWYARRRLEGQDGFYPDIDLEHIKFEAAGLAVLDDGYNSDSTTPGSASVEFHLRRDAATGAIPLVVTTGSAIT